MDKLAAMETFLRVVETGSFTRAAEAMNLPKARVSQRVNDLEHLLGVRLLQRTTRTLRVTDDGRAYYAKCQCLLQELDELEGTLKGGARSPTGILRVDALVSVARWVLAPRLHEFSERHPGLTLRLASSDRISRLAEEGIDCAIRGGTLRDSTLVARRLCDVQLGLYASPTYAHTLGKVAHPQDLATAKRLTWFNGRPQEAFGWPLLHGKERFELNPMQGMQFDDPDVAMTACITGGGICPGAPFAVQHWVYSGELVSILPDWHFPGRPISLVYPSSRHLSGRVRVFADWVSEVFATDPTISLTPAALAEASSTGRKVISARMKARRHQGQE